MEVPEAKIQCLWSDSLSRVPAGVTGTVICPNHMGKQPQRENAPFTYLLLQSKAPPVHCDGMTDTRRAQP